MIPRREHWHGTGGDREPPSPADAARRVVEMAERLRPDWQQPERFFEAKSSLIAACRRLAATLERNPTHER
jgi:hypothetical protein